MNDVPFPKTFYIYRETTLEDEDDPDDPPMWVCSEILADAVGCNPSHVGTYVFMEAKYYERIIREIREN